MSAKLFSYRVDSVRGKTVVTTVFLSGVFTPGKVRYALLAPAGTRSSTSSLVLEADGLPVTVQVASCAVGLILTRSSGLGANVIDLDRLAVPRPETYRDGRPTGALPGG